MRNIPDTFETRKRSFISAFSICMTVPLIACMVPAFRLAFRIFLILLVVFLRYQIFHFFTLHIIKLTHPDT